MLRKYLLKQHIIKHTLESTITQKIIVQHLCTSMAVGGSFRHLPLLVRQLERVLRLGEGCTNEHRKGGGSGEDERAKDDCRLKSIEMMDKEWPGKTHSHEQSAISFTYLSYNNEKATVHVEEPTTLIFECYTTAGSRLVICKLLIGTLCAGGYTGNCLLSHWHQLPRLDHGTFPLI